MEDAVDMDVFKRIKDEIERTNAIMPDATGEEKKAQVMADLQIILDDLIIPVGKSMLNLLIEMAVAYLKLEAIP